MLTFVDLFCGGGFGAWGARKGGGIPLLGIDAWKIAALNYQRNFPDASVICSKVEDIDPTRVAEQFKPDVLLTSPECTAHSIARGSKPGEESSRETALSIIPWLEALEPRWLIVENVNRMKSWTRHDELVESIEAAGYTVSDLFLNSAHFGVPQARKRLFLVCDREGTVVDEVQLKASHSKKEKFASDILSAPDQFGWTPLNKEGRAQSTLDRAERAVDALGSNVPFLLVYYGSDYAGGWQPLDAPLRTITTVDRFGLVNWDNGEPMIRMLQPDELIRAMGARGLKLPLGTRREKVHLCGNGVCSPVVESIFKVIGSTATENRPLANHAA